MAFRNLFANPGPAGPPVDRAAQAIAAVREYVPDAGDAALSALVGRLMAAKGMQGPIPNLPASIDAIYDEMARRPRFMAGPQNPPFNLAAHMQRLHNLFQVAHNEVAQQEDPNADAEMNGGRGRRTRRTRKTMRGRGGFSFGTTATAPRSSILREGSVLGQAAAAAMKAKFDEGVLKATDAMTARAAEKLNTVKTGVFDTLTAKLPQTPEAYRNFVTTAQTARMANADRMMNNPMRKTAGRRRLTRRRRR